MKELGGQGLEGTEGGRYLPEEIWQRRPEDSVWLTDFKPTVVSGFANPRGSSSRIVLHLHLLKRSLLGPTNSVFFSGKKKPDQPNKPSFIQQIELFNHAFKNKSSVIKLSALCLQCREKYLHVCLKKRNTLFVKKSRHFTGPTHRESLEVPMHDVPFQGKSARMVQLRLGG